MKTVLLSMLCLAGGLASAGEGPAFPADPAHACDSCGEWNAPVEPFRLFGNTYYVGVAGLSSVLVTSTQGHILLDGGLPQSAALIDANIRRLGFRTEDVRLILNSHAHYDHAGGIAALQRVSRARVAASAAGATALAQGGPTADDPQFGLGREAMALPAVPDVRVVQDGETLRVGPLAVTAHLTPGHTPGGTTWTWRSCQGSRCVDVVYADSLNPVSAPGFRFTGRPGHPGPADALRRSIALVRALPCDLLVSVHPSFSGLDQKREKLRTKPGSQPFLDRGACKDYAENAEHLLDVRVARERAESPATP